MIEIEILYTLVQSLQIYNISIEVTVMIYLEVHSARLCLFKMPCGKKKHSKEYSVDDVLKMNFLLVVMIVKSRGDFVKACNVCLCLLDKIQHNCNCINHV